MQLEIFSRELVEGLVREASHTVLSRMKDRCALSHMMEAPPGLGVSCSRQRYSHTRVPQQFVCKAIYPIATALQSRAQLLLPQHNEFERKFDEREFD